MMSHIINSGKLIVCCIIILAICACGKIDKDAVRLSGWVSSPIEDKMVQALVDEFEKKHPDIKVNYEPIPGNYMDKIQLMLATNTAPDVFYLDAFYTPALISYGVLEPLDGYIRADSINIDDFEPSLLTAFQSGGKTYGLPKDYTTFGLFYNIDMFKQAGIDHPPTNWEEFLFTSKKLTRDTDGDGKIDQWGFCLLPSLEYLLPFVFQNGGSFIDRQNTEFKITQPSFLEALRFYVDLYKSGYAIQPSYVGAQWPGDAFGKGGAAMIYSGNFAIPFLKNTYPDIRYGIAPLPRHKFESTMAFVVAYVIPKTSKKKKSAWTLLNYLTNVEGMTKWTNLGLALPPRRSVAKIIKCDSDSLKRALVAGAKYAVPWQFSENLRIIDETQTALQEIMLLGKPPESVIKKLYDRLTAMNERRINKGGKKSR